jgi:hypothetical protein
LNVAETREKLRMKKPLRVFAFLLAYTLLLGVLTYLVDAFFRQTYFFFTAIDLVMVFTNVFMFSLFILYRAKTRKAWISREAEKWLEVRSRERIRPSPLWRKNAHKGLLWLPSAIVLVAFLFLPEIAGVVSHVWHGRSLDLQRFHLRTPLTWVLVTDESSDCWAFASKGIARAGIGPYLRNEPPFSEVHFYAVLQPGADLSHADEPSRVARVISQRSIPFGDRTLSCWDVIPPHPVHGPESIDYSFADIRCATKPYDFWAHFSGLRGDSPLFYETLQNVVITKSTQQTEPHER